MSDTLHATRLGECTALLTNVTSVKINFNITVKLTTHELQVIIDVPKLNTAIKNRHQMRTYAEDSKVTLGLTKGKWLELSTIKGFEQNSLGFLVISFSDKYLWTASTNVATSIPQASSEITCRGQKKKLVMFEKSLQPILYFFYFKKIFHT
jgi:hypothetical protein